MCRSNLQAVGPAILAAVAGTLFGIASCQDNEVGNAHLSLEAKKLLRKLRQAESLEIEYMAKELNPRGTGRSRTRIVSVTDKARVNKLTSTIAFAQNPEWGSEMLIEICVVRFLFDDDSLIQIKYLTPQRMQTQIPKTEIIELGDSRFYQEICKVLSDAEGKPVDPFADWESR